MAINTYFKNIANAIREKTGGSAFITPGQMPQEILNIPAGGMEWIEPLHEHFKGGYLDGNRFYKSTVTNGNSSIYYLNVSETTYFFFANDNNTNRMRINEFASDPFNATSNFDGQNRLSNNNTSLYHYSIVTIHAGYPYVMVDIGNVANTLNSKIICAKADDLFL